MAELDTTLVNVGLTPNDGTGNNIREAFIKTNQNITAITEFLMLGPMLANLTVRDSIITHSIVSNIGDFTESLHISSNVASISPITGALTVVGGVGVEGNVNVGGTIYGDVEGDVVTASTLGVNGGSILRGNVMTGSLSVGSDLDKKDLIVTRNAEVWGELIVHGNVTTVSTSVFNVEASVITVGKAANVDLSSNDGKDRGVEFFWFDDTDSNQKEGFFGFQNSSKKFTYIPRSHYGAPGDTDIFLGDYGDARFNEVEANIVSTGTSTFNNISTTTITATNGITGTLMTAAQPNITSVGTLTSLEVAGNVSVANGNVYVTGGSLYINGVPAATSAEAFHGGTVALDTIFTSGTNSISSATGAVRVVGGLGVTGNVNVGNQINVPLITATTIGGTLTTAEQPNITTVGALGNLVVSDSLSSYSFSAHHATFGSYINAATVGGTITTAAQPNITSVGTLNSLNVTGNVVANSFTGIFNGAFAGNVSGDISGSAATVRNAAQPAITSVGTLTSLSVSGNVTVSNLDAGAGVIQTTGNVISSSLYGQVKTAAQPSVTSLGNLTSLTVTGTSTLVGAVTLSSTLGASGAGTQNIGSNANRFGTAYVTSVNSSGSISALNFDGTIGANAPTSATFTSATASGQIWSTTGGFKFPDGTIQTTAGVAGSGSVSYATTAGTSTTAGNVTGIVAIVNGGTGAANTAQALANLGAYPAANPNGYTSNVGTVTEVTGAGSVNGLTLTGSVTTSGALTLGGTLALGNLSTTGSSGSCTGNAATATVANTILSQANSATINAVTTNTANAIVLRDASGNFTAGTITANLLGNASTATVANAITGQANSATINATSVSISNAIVLRDASGNFTAGTITANLLGNASTASTITSQANSATINATSANTPNTIALRDGSGNFNAGVITAIATSAYYADLAEMYHSDSAYEPGSVLVFGGTCEVTIAGSFADVSVAGVVSTDPAYLMNISAVDAVPVALRGKVPVKLIGPVRKGDLLVTSYVPGYAESVGKVNTFGAAVFGKSLTEDLAEGAKTINAVIL